MDALAFLNLGPSEVALLLVLFLLLFGADKVPDLARGLGRARASLDRAQREVKEQMSTPEESALERQLAFERAREAHVAALQKGEADPAGPRGEGPKE